MLYAAVRLPHTHFAIYNIRDFISILIFFRICFVNSYSMYFVLDNLTKASGLEIGNSFQSGNLEALSSECNIFRLEHVCPLGLRIIAQK